ncbi:hypothetical protein LY76DRAFT_372958 [Colletotrichum caudatum]|nr:hypothetical protein LY76DRAFT_372958 [Colletotrichum caudatum]
MLLVVDLYLRVSADCQLPTSKPCFCLLAEAWRMSHRNTMVLSGRIIGLIVSHQMSPDRQGRHRERRQESDVFKEQRPIFTLQCLVYNALLHLPAFIAVTQDTTTLNSLHRQFYHLLSKESQATDYLLISFAMPETTPPPPKDTTPTDAVRSVRTTVRG